jgi:DNA-binding SARP family transcriptional activator
VIAFLSVAGWQFDMSLRIEFFGDFRLSRAEVPLRGFATAAAKSLFSYLVMHRNRLHDRDVLAGTFYGDRPQTEARRSLRLNLWRIRQVMGDAPAPSRTSLVVHDRQIGFNVECDYSFDVEEFERNIGEARRLAAKGHLVESDAHLTAAVALYRGDLLEGIYDEWCVTDQARLRALFLHALETLMDSASQRGDVRVALLHGERLLSHDPLRETVHREIMRLKYRLGDRAAAVHQFRECARTLATELGVQPMRETHALYEAMVADRPDAAAAPPAAMPHVVPGLADSLADAATQLEQIVTSLRRSIDAIDAPRAVAAPSIVK